MADFIDEMQEELKKENVLLFLKRHKKSFFFFIASVFLGVFLYGIYANHREKGWDLDYQTYQNVVKKLDAGEYQEASKSLDALLVKKGGFSFLGWLQAARLSSRHFLMIPNKESYGKLMGDYERVLASEDRIDLAVDSFLKTASLYQALAGNFPYPDYIPEFLEAPSPEGSPWGVLSLLGRSLDLYSKDRFSESSEVLEEVEGISKGQYNQSDLAHFFTILKAGISSKNDNS